MNEFKKWFDSPPKSGDDYLGFRTTDETQSHTQTAIFLFETLKACKAICDDLGLASESALFAVYDRFIDRFNSMDADNPYEQSMEALLQQLRLNKETEDAD